MSSIDEKKQKLINKEISVSDLTVDEVEKLTKAVSQDLDDKKEELNNLNKKIKEMKVKIDNWSN